MSGDREAMAKLSMPDLEKILYATLTGMTVDDFNAEVRSGSQQPKTGAGSDLIPNSPTSRCRKC